MGYHPLGPSSWPIWLRKLLPGQKKFYEGAISHDYLYEFCKNEEDRKKADVIFLVLCLESSDSIKWELLALSYYLMVRVGGKKRIGK